MAELAALNAIAAVRGERAPHPVNPEVSAAESSSAGVRRA
jgi:hypothetical protein